MSVLCYTEQSMQTHLDIVKQQSYIATMTSCNLKQLWHFRISHLYSTHGDTYTSTHTNKP